MQHEDIKLYNLEIISISCKKILKIVDQNDANEFENDSILQDVVLMNLIRIGECAIRLSKYFSDEVNDHFKGPISMRHKIAHGYDVLLMSAVYAIEKEDVRSLSNFIKTI